MAGIDLRSFFIKDILDRAEAKIQQTTGTRGYECSNNEKGFVGRSFVTHQ